MHSWQGKAIFQKHSWQGKAIFQKTLSLQLSHSNHKDNFNKPAPPPPPPPTHTNDSHPPSKKKSAVTLKEYNHKRPESPTRWELP